MSWWNDALARYGPVGFGLGVGTLAKQGLVLSDGGSISWKGLLADLLLLGFLGVIALNVSDQFHLQGKSSVLMGAMAAVSSDRLVRMVRKRFEQRVAAEVGQRVATEVAAEVEKLPTNKLATLLGGKPPKNGEAFEPLLEEIDAADKAR